MQMLYGSAKNSGETSEGENSEHACLAIGFESIVEARRRAALLLALTWRPLQKQGTQLLPIAATSFGKALIAKGARDQTTDMKVRISWRVAQTNQSETSVHSQIQTMYKRHWL